MRRLIIFLAAIFMLAGTASAQQLAMQQRVTTSWHGLSGLYVIPTARTIGEGNLALCFNESKHSEFIAGEKHFDRHITGVVTYGITDRLEVSGTYYNNLFMLPPNPRGDLDNQSFKTFGIKYQLMKEHPYYWYPTVSIAVRDVFGDTAEFGGFEYINNGTRGFILASRKILKNVEKGRFMDLHAGISFDHNGTSGLAGFELTLAPNVSMIAEWIYDSPYVNFKNFGTNDVRGRFLFDTGVRIYPELVPGMVLDLGFVGDSEFEFSFGVSYVIDL